MAGALKDHLPLARDAQTGWTPYVGRTADVVDSSIVDCLRMYEDNIRYEGP